MTYAGQPAPRRSRELREQRPRLESALTVPAEGNFPLVVVAAHGLLATTTIVLVLLTALGVGGS